MSETTLTIIVTDPNFLTDYAHRITSKMRLKNEVDVIGNNEAMGRAASACNLMTDEIPEYVNCLLTGAFGKKLHFSSTIVRLHTPQP